MPPLPILSSLSAPQTSRILNSILPGLDLTLHKHIPKLSLQGLSHSFVIPPCGIKVTPTSVCPHYCVFIFKINDTVINFTPVVSLSTHLTQTGKWGLCGCLNHKAQFIRSINATKSKPAAAMPPLRPWWKHRPMHHSWPALLPRSVLLNLTLT